MELKRGDLVRWITDHNIYESSGEVSVKNPGAVIVFCYDCKKKREGTRMILDATQDRLEILSGESSG